MLKIKASTILDVAKKAGVSSMTVTRAFRGEAVAEETSRRVMAAAAELNYQPNTGARIMRGGRTMSVGILFSNPANNPTVRRLSEQLMHEHYVSYIVDTLGDPELTLAALRDFKARRVDMVVMYYEPAYLPFAGEIDSVSNLVAVTSLPKIPQTCDVCVHSCTEAYKQALEYARAAGRRCFCSVGRGTYPAIRQLRRAAEALDLALEHCETSAYPSAPLCANHAQAFADFLQNGGRADCVFAMSDTAAAQIVCVAKKFGLRVPEDLYVLGCGNFELAEFCRIPLASINPGDMELARKITALALSRLRAPGLPLRRESVEATLVLRKSFQS